MLQERRRHERQLVRPRPYVAVNGSSSGGMLYDVSEGGMAVDILGPRPTSDNVLLNFDLAEIGEHFETKGKITWAHEAQNRVGFKFVDVSEEAQRKIRLWLIKKAVVEDIERYSMPAMAVGDNAPLSSSVRLPEKMQAAPANLRAAEAKKVSTVAPEVVVRKAVEPPAAKIPEAHIAPPIAAPDDHLVNGLRSSFSADARSARAPTTNLEKERVPLDREILKRWITFATVIFLMIVAVAVAKWIYTTPALDKIASGSFRDIVANTFNLPSDKSQASENSGTANTLAGKDGRPVRRDAKSLQHPRTPQQSTSQQDSNQRPPQFEVLNAQNGRVTLPSSGSSTASAPPNNAGAVNVAEVSGGQPASGSLMQEPGSTKVGLVMLHPSTEVPENKVLPEYPALALQKNVQGRVVLHAVIAKDGLLHDVRLVGPPSLLSGPVLEAVKSWRYLPRYQNGVPVEVETQITIDFEINAR
jgi:TonB family protein